MALATVTKLCVPLLLVLLCKCQAAVIDDTELVFHNQFAVHIPNATEPLVQFVAEKHGFRSLGQIGSLEGYYLLEHARIHKRSAEPSRYHHEKLVNEPGVVWVAQQHERHRVKRDFNNNPARSSLSSLVFGRGSEFPDPFYKEQLYLHGGALQGFDMNVIPA